MTTAPNRVMPWATSPSGRWRSSSSSTKGTRRLPRDVTKYRPSGNSMGRGRDIDRAWASTFEAVPSRMTGFAMQTPLAASLGADTQAFRGVVRADLPQKPLTSTPSVERGACGGNSASRTGFDCPVRSRLRSLRARRRRVDGERSREETFRPPSQLRRVVIPN